MIPLRSKFPTRTHFLEFRRTAKQLTTPRLRIFVSTHAPSRLSVIVPAKVNKRAVVRNALRRKVYDSFWPTIKDKNLDCVILFKPLALVKGEESAQHIAAELNELHV